MNEARKARTLAAMRDYMRGRSEGGPRSPAGNRGRPRTSHFRFSAEHREKKT